MVKRFHSLRYLIFICLFLNIGFVQAKTLTVVSPGPGHPMYEIATRVLSEAFDELGYEVVFKDFPPRRVIAMFDNSGADGLLFATELFLDDRPSAIKVEPALGYDELMVFSKSSALTVNGWDSIRSYSIGYMKGMDAVENRIKGMQTDGAENPEQAFKMLLGGRTDIVVLPRLIGCRLMNRFPEIKMQEPPLEKVALYTYLRAEREEIIAELTRVLRAMKTNGHLDAITDQVLADGLKECSGD